MRTTEVSKKKKRTSNSSDDDFIASKNGSKHNEHTSSPNLKSNPGKSSWLGEVVNSETKHQFEEFGEVLIFGLGKYLAEA